MSTYSNGHILAPYLAAAFPCVAIVTREEERCIRSIVDRWPDRPAFLIASVGGLRDARTGTVIEPAMQWPGAFAYLAERPEAILLVLDLRMPIQNAPIYRALKSQFPRYKQIGAMAALIGPSWSLPAEIQHDVPVIDFALPTRPELSAALDVVAESVGQTPDPALREACLDSAAGLTLAEAENAYALSYVRDRNFSPERIQDEKLAQIRRSGFLEVYQPLNPDLLGGMGALKEFIADEVMPVRDDELLRVRGIGLSGIPGTGKTLACKVIGSILGYPIARMDTGRIKGSHVGQTEGQMQQTLALVEAVAPCILFIDEAEKFAGGYASSAQTDGGTMLATVGILLTWMQEHRSKVVTVFTCNDHTKLPPEFSRAGRINKMFFVDLPSRVERMEIARVHLGRVGVAPGDIPTWIAELSREWTGAEIEELILSAARRTRRQITAAALREAAAGIKPISKVRAAEIKALREWARGALPFANTPEADEGPATGRRLVVGE